MSDQGNVQPTFAHKNWMDGTFEQSFNDIMNWVDQNYRTRAAKRYRAIAGLSMGGYHSLYISANQPDNITFRVAGDCLYADGAEDGTPVTLYNLQGVVVAQTQVQDGMISLAGLHKGVYAVQLAKLGSTLIRK
jgi:hypothetical protein